jgi:hypothetical protein
MKRFRVKQENDLRQTHLLSRQFMVYTEMTKHVIRMKHSQNVSHVLHDETTANERSYIAAIFMSKLHEGRIHRNQFIERK